MITQDCDPSEAEIRRQMELLKVSSAIGRRSLLTEFHVLSLRELVDVNMYHWVDCGFLRMVYVFDSVAKVDNSLAEIGPPLD